VREACGDAHLKVILETGELATLDNVARASWLAMLAGAEGVISVAANVAPAPLRELCNAALGGDTAHAQALNTNLTALYDLLGAEPNPIPLKWCLHRLGIGTPDLRLPLLPLSPAYHEQGRRVLRDLHLSLAVQPRHSSAA